MPTAKRLLPLLIALTLAGCAVTPKSKHRDAPLIAEATERFRNGDFSGASLVYQRLAEQADDSESSYYRLLAADAELRSGNDRAAQALLGVIEPEALEEGDRQRYALLRSRLDLNQGKAREAMARLDGLDEQRLTSALRANYHILRASAYNQLGNMLESARERVYYGQLINNPEAVQKNNEGIYDALNRMPYAVLSGMQPSTPGTLGGWMALVIALRGPEANRMQALQAWRAKYPGHPANGAFVQRFMEKPSKPSVEVSALRPVEPPPAQPVATTPPAAPAAEVPAAQPAPAGGGFVGVLLPLTGQFNLAAQAVRTGLTAAWGADGGPAKPELRYVDTQGGDVVALYQKLVQEGAKYVIGPLTKDEVAALGRAPELPVPVLALNQAADINRDGFYQFALTPEQEVEQAASLAWFDGRQSALVLAPASALGQRLASHFSSYWQSLGGKIASAKTYPPGAADYSGVAKQLLAGLEAGEASETSPEFIFLIADSRDGRLLNPHIQNQEGGDKLPIYATSLIFNGQPAAPQNQDLSGVTFCDSPWLLGSDGGPLSRQGLQVAAQQTPELYLRLLPMGIDAYQLLPELDQLKSGALGRHNGATGVLTVKAGNRVQRQLQCARYEGAALQMRGLAPSLQPGMAPASP